MSEDVRLSACVIMRDAAEDIGACLRSLLGLVDEFVVVDTGSVDDSVAIAERLVGKVYHFPWREDFSAAKNYAIEQSRGEWIIFLDADEALTEETRGNLPEILHRYGGQNGPDVMELFRCNVNTGTGEVMSRNYDERIFRRSLRYHDAIHEYLSYGDGREKRTLRIPPEELVLRHTGYSPERMAEKTARNLRMLEAERQKGSGKKYLFYYLSGLYLHEKEYEKAAEAAWKSIEGGENPPTDPFGAYRNCYEAVKASGDMEEILRVLRRGMEDHPLRPEFFALYGDRIRGEGDTMEAYGAMKKALRNLRDFSRNFPGEEHSLQGSQYQVYGVMSEICAALGKQGEAGKYRKKALREAPKQEKRKKGS